MQKSNSKKTAGSLLLTVILVMMGLFAFGFSIPHVNTDTLPQAVKPNDTVLVFENNACSLAKRVSFKGKKVQVLYLNDAQTLTELVSKKNVFIPTVSGTGAEEQIVRFRYLDPLIAEYTILKGTVLGRNGDYYLIEFTNLGKTEVTVKHKSDIVRNDL